jgi:hypothetical protein
MKQPITMFQYELLKQLRKEFAIEHKHLPVKKRGSLTFALNTLAEKGFANRIVEKNEVIWTLAEKGKQPKTTKRRN